MACNVGTHNEGGVCVANVAAGGKRRMTRKAGRKGSKKSMRKNVVMGGKRRAATRKGRQGSRKSRSSRR